VADNKKWACVGGMNELINKLNLHDCMHRGGGIDIGVTN